MDLRTAKAFSDNLVLGGLITVAGSAAGLWLPVGVALLLLALALCRICWLEDNIHHDLLNASRVPAGYQACRARRSALLGLLIRPDGRDPNCPKRLASELRVQSHALAAFAWGLAGGAILTAGVPLTFALGAAALILALRQADYLAFGAALLSTGQPLPHRLIAARGPFSSLAVIPHRQD